jgi:hypothetical protein
MHGVNKFRSYGYVLIIVAILLPAQKYRLYVNSLIAAHKQKRCEIKNGRPRCISSGVPKYLCQVSAFWVSSFLS